MSRPFTSLYRPDREPLVHEDYGSSTDFRVYVRRFCLPNGMMQIAYSSSQTGTTGSTWMCLTITVSSTCHPQLIGSIIVLMYFLSGCELYGRSLGTA